MTHSGQFTHKAVTCQPQIGHRYGKVRQPKNDILTMEPFCQTVGPNAVWTCLTVILNALIYLLTYTCVNVILILLFPQLTISYIDRYDKYAGSKHARLNVKWKQTAKHTRSSTDFTDHRLSTRKIAVLVLRLQNQRGRAGHNAD